MEKIINTFLDVSVGENLEVKKLDVFCSKPLEVYYYFYSKDGFLLFEIDKKGDDFELIKGRQGLFNSVKIFFSLEEDEAFNYVKNWVFEKYIPKINTYIL